MHTMLRQRNTIFTFRIDRQTSVHHMNFELRMDMSTHPTKTDPGLSLAWIYITDPLEFLMPRIVLCASVLLPRCHGWRQCPKDSVPKRWGNAKAHVLDSEVMAEVIPLHIRQSFNESKPVEISMEHLANSWLFIRGIRSSPWDVLLGLWMVVHGAGSSECNHTSHIPTDHLQIMQVW